jgi:hypothetical protein
VEVGCPLQFSTTLAGPEVPQGEIPMGIQLPFFIETPSVATFARRVVCRHSQDQRSILSGAVMRARASAVRLIFLILLLSFDSSGTQQEDFQRDTQTSRVITCHKSAMKEFSRPLPHPRRSGSTKDMSRSSTACDQTFSQAEGSSASQAEGLSVSK